MDKSPTKAQPKAPTQPKPPKAAAVAATKPPADSVATEQPAGKGGRAKEDVVHFGYDNEHEHGVHCTLTFADGATAVGTAPRTESLAADQAAASANALESAA